MKCRPVHSPNFLKIAAKIFISSSASFNSNSRSSYSSFTSYVNICFNQSIDSLDSFLLILILNLKSLSPNLSFASI